MYTFRLDVDRFDSNVLTIMELGSERGQEMASVPTALTDIITY